MSRVGKLPIKVPAGVKVAVQGTKVVVEGPKGKLNYECPTAITLKVSPGLIEVTRTEDDSTSASLHGLVRTLVGNMVHGVSQGFSRELDIVGVGYRAAAKGNVLTLNVGFSHPIDFKLPDGITARVDNNTKVSISGADKMLVGLVAAKVRGFKKPEPYQGKGIKYSDEVIQRKQGKAAGAK